MYRFRGRGALIVIANALLGLPPVVVGLVVYLLLSRSGPLGSLGILFTPTAMVVAQAVFGIPIAPGTSGVVSDRLVSAGTGRSSYEVCSE